MKKLYIIFILLSIGIMNSGMTYAQRPGHLNRIIEGHKIHMDLKTFLSYNDYEPVVHLNKVRMIPKAVAEVIHVSPGTLSSTLTTAQKQTITNLKLTGQIDARDFKTMRDIMSVLSDIDISGISIAAYTGTQGTAGQTNFTYPANTIPQNAFLSDHTLITMLLPPDITSIGDSAFYNCGLTDDNLTFPNSVVSIGNSAYESCWNLTGTITLPNSVITIGEYIFAGCQNFTTIVLSNSLTSISKGAFDQDWSLYGNLTIPNSVTSIGDYAFYYSYLTEVTIPNSVTSIGEGAFDKCKFLNNVILPNSITSISDYTFSLCARLTTITLPNSITSIGDFAFTMSGLTSISIPNAVTTIGASAFTMCNLHGGLMIPNSVLTIKTGAFSLNDITEFMVQNDNSNFSVVDGVLFDKNKTTLKVYPSGKKGIYTIPAFVTLIDAGAFNYCNALTGINIPSTVKSIGNNAFEGCFQMLTIYAYPILPIDLSHSTDVFKDFNYSTVTLYVPYGSKTLYQAANQWSNFINIIEMSPTSMLEPNVGGNIILYPNPFTDGFYIDAVDNTAIISVFTLNGTKCLSKQAVNKSFIDLTGLPTGEYMVTVTSREGTVRKIILKR